MEQGSEVQSLLALRFLCVQAAVAAVAAQDLLVLVLVLLMPKWQLQRTRALASAEILLKNLGLAPEHPPALDCKKGLGLGLQALVWVSVLEVPVLLKQLPGLVAGPQALMQAQGRQLLQMSGLGLALLLLTLLLLLLAYDNPQQWLALVPDLGASL